MTRTRPTALRLLLHAGTGLAALALGVLPSPWHGIGAACGVIAGFLILPLVGLDRRLRRDGERWWGGLRTYPLAVFGLVLLLPRAEAAAAWGVLAFGDAAAGWIGSRVPSPALLGHAKATWSGTAAGVVGGTVGAFALAAGVVALIPHSFPPGVAPESGVGLFRCAAAACAGTLASLVPIPPDDNLPTAVAAGLFLTVLP